MVCIGRRHCASPPPLYPLPRISLQVRSNQERASHCCAQLGCSSPVPLSPPGRAMLRILGEDKAMVEQLRPDLLPQEYSVRADLPQIAFRCGSSSAAV